MTESNKAQAFDLQMAVERLKRSDENVRLAALAQILVAKAGANAIAEVEACLNQGSERVRRAAVVVLGEIGAPAVSALADALDPRQAPLIRSLAAAMLAAMGADAAPAIDPLIQCLSVKESDLTIHAALALGRIGAPAVPALRKVLADSDLGIRGAAADALGHAGPAAADGLEDLRCAAKAAPQPMLGLAYASAMVKISGDPKAGLPVLIEALEDKNAQFRARVIEKIGELRALASDAALAVMERLKDPVAKVRANAALGLARIGASSPESVAALTQALGDAEAEVRLNAGIALGTFGAASTSAVPQLCTMKNDKEARVATVARAALDRIAATKENHDARP
jgi:HEAT repeat protein